MDLRCPMTKVLEGGECLFAEVRLGKVPGESAALSARSPGGSLFIAG